MALLALALALALSVCWVSRALITLNLTRSGQAGPGPAMAGNKDATCILDVPAIPADTFRPTGGASR